MITKSQLFSLINYIDMNPNFSLESAAEKIEPRLKVLQAHYKEIIEKYKPVLDHAIDQLTYIEGLLSGFSTVPTSQVPKSQEFQSIVVKSEVKVESPKVIVTREAVTKNVAPKTKARKAPKLSSSSKSLTLLSKFTGETLTSAVAKVLEDRRGKEVGIEEVVTALYGKIGSEEFKVAKDRVTKNLSKGKVSGLWERVPEKIGYYTAKAIVKSTPKVKIKA